MISRYIRELGNTWVYVLGVAVLGVIVSVIVCMGVNKNTIAEVPVTIEELLMNEPTYSEEVHSETDNSVSGHADDEPVLAENNITIQNEESESDEDTLVANSEFVELAGEPEVTEYNPYDVFINEFNLLKSKDSDTIAKYFGQSDVFTPDMVADKMLATVISFVSDEVISETEHNLIIHICTLDYNKMNESTQEIRSNIEADASIAAEDKDEVAKMEVAKNVVKGEYDTHYTIPVKVTSSGVAVTEQLKQAMTGNWYKGTGVSIAEVECPMEDSVSEAIVNSMDESTENIA